ncbi:patatin-like phospholipase family protein [Rhizobium acidisoli]
MVAAPERSAVTIPIRALGHWKTVTRLVDFDYLNGGDVRLVVSATDVSTGEEQVYDTSQMEITIDHLMASSAFPVLFPSEPVGDRHMVDGGLAANLPILPLFREPPACPVKCLAFDLVQANGPVPNTLDDAVHRMQDLLLANQSQRSMELLKHRASGWPVPISALHISYKGEREVGGKMLEFSTASMKVRTDAGKSDAEIAMRWLDEAGLPGSHADHIEEYEFGVSG